MKNLIVVNGTMGSGKTTVCELLYRMLPNSVLLDGDWCWMLHPFIPTGEDKRMALQNIAFLLQSFLNHTGIENIVFCWVLP